MFEESARQFRTTDDAWGLRNALNGLGEVERAQGEFEHAEALYEEGLALARQVGDEHGIGLMLYNLALVAVHHANAPRATDLLTQVVRVWTRLGYRSGLVTSVGLLGAVASLRQRFELAVRLYGAAEVLYARVGRGDVAGERAAYAIYLPHARTRLDPPVFAAAWEAGKAMSLEQALADGLGAEAPVSTVGALRASHEPLTLREWEVAQLVARGLTNRQIGSELVVTEATAAKHVENIRMKLELTSRTQVAAWVFAHT